MPYRPKAMKLQVDREATRTWVYPTNKEHRDYQFNIVQRALFNNVLVALPTGLGKTFIAAVVILNYYRWYPKGKSESTTLFQWTWPLLLIVPSSCASHLCGAH